MREEQSSDDEHDQNNPRSVKRYRGQIADLFSSRDEELDSAIDAVAGNRFGRNALLWFLCVLVQAVLFYYITVVLLL